MTITRAAGDHGVLIELPDNDAAVSVARALAVRPDVEEVVPGQRTVLVTWPIGAPPPDLSAIADDPPPPVAGRSIEIPVVYDGADLAQVAHLTNLSSDEVVDAHLAPEYTVAFLGFAPGFAYLLGGDPRLEVPRLERPRERVPAGSVGIAGPYSGVYPRESPGGWQLLGRTAMTLFDPQGTPPALLACGDRVRFVRA